MRANTLKNAELLVVFHPARSNISVGFCMTCFLLNKRVVIKCSTPCSGNIHLNVSKNNGMGTAVHVSACGCTEGQIA